MAYNADTLTSICLDFWEWMLKEFPEFASSTGDHRYADCVESYSLEAMKHRQKSVEVFWQRLRRLDVPRSSLVERLNYEILLTSIEYYLDGYKWHRYAALNPHNDLEGVGSQCITLALDCQTVESFTKAVSRLRKYPAQIRQQMDLMKVAVATGMTNHITSMERVCPNIEKLLEVSVNESDLFKPYKEALEENTDIDDTKKAMLRNEAEAAVADIYSSLADLIAMIRTEYLPNTRPFFGVSNFPCGMEYYQACLRWHTTTSMTPTECHSLGLKEVQRIQASITEIMSGIGFSGSLREFLATLKSTHNNLVLSEKELLKRYQELIIKADSRLSTVLYSEDIPSVPCIVEAMKTNGPAGRYKSPARPGEHGRFLVNVQNPGQRATYVMMCLVLHEVNPGHHCQCTIQQQARDLPSFRKYTDFSKYFAVPYNFPFYTAYIEGWGLYAEYLGEEMDLYESPYDWYGRRLYELTRAARLVVDVGIHAFGWTKQEAVDYLIDIGALTSDGAINEVNRMITWPGQACAYKVGELKIKELRAKAERALSCVSGFDVKEFHRQVLRLGPAPLTILENHIDDWIAIKVQAASAGLLDA